MQVRDHTSELAGAEFDVAAVGFSPPEALAPLADHLDWPHPFASDVDRVLYARLGIRRAPLRNVFNGRTLARYRDAIFGGRRLHAPVEDIRQLGGDVLVVDGVARLLALPASPDDRPSVDDLVAGARALADGA